MAYGEATWKQVYTQAINREESSQAASTLVAICVAALPSCDESLTEIRTGGFPSGRPTKATVRDAAHSLLQICQLHTDDVEIAKRMPLALLSLHYQPQGLELGPAIQRAAEAAELAASDPLVRALCLLQLAARQRSSNQKQESLHTQIGCLQGLRSDVGLTDTDHWLYRDAPFYRHGTPVPVDVALAFTVKSQVVV